MKTSSLTSTKPPTAVRMPSASSPNLTAMLHFAERPRGGGEARAVRWGRAEPVDQPRRRIVRIAQFLPRGSELRLRILRHFPGVGRADAAFAFEPRHRRPFGDGRTRAL